MPSNEQRREAAKRKLARQLERREQRTRRRKQLTIAGAVIGVVVVAAAIGTTVALTGGGSTATNADAHPQGDPLPPVKALPASVTCAYPTGAPSVKPVSPPPTANISAVGSAKVALDTTQGKIGLTVNRAEAPCTVNSMVSLAQQKYFDNTPCHRLTTDSIYVMQCGDPSGKGTGGPGYGFANEYPTSQLASNDPALGKPAIYPRGTIAMANTGQQGSNGSQFFLVYKDSPLPPTYTVFGKIDDDGLKTLDKIAEKGSTNSNGPGDGAPAAPVFIKTAQVA